MNPILQLRWMIAMLECQRLIARDRFEAEVDANATEVIVDLRTELATLQRFHDESVAAYNTPGPADLPGLDNPP